jgi:excisionase family DNA binding protein
VRYIDGTTYYTVGEVAEAAGVSAQTIRVWERRGRVRTRRTPGGHRLFDETALQAVRGHASTLRRRISAEPRPTGVVPGIGDWEVAATGARLRALRENAGLTQKELASEIDVSRSLLSSIERGESGVSMTVFSRIAEALRLPVSELAPPMSTSQLVVTQAQRPRTALGNGLTWEELASAGHTMAPAYMYAAPGASSGGAVLNPRESWFLVLAGQLTMRLGPEESGDDLVLRPGDSLILPAGQLYEWSNRDDIQSTVIVVEHQGARAAERRAT